MIRIVVTLCAAEALALVGTFAFPALLPTFQQAWNLSNAEAGWISGVYFLGYALAVPILSSLTDRIDARGVFLAGATACAASSFAFVAAGGFWSAMALRVIGGIGLAGVYMPGLKALVDRVDSTRAIAYYTASFSLGTMLSFMASGEIGVRLGWQAAFLCAGGAGTLSVLLAATLRPARPVAPPATGVFAFGRVLANRAAMGYILGYAAHSWELFAFRAWVVSFLTFARGSAAPQTDWNPTTVATVCAGLGMLASIGGADIAIRFGRRRLCLLAMLGSGGMALALGWAADLPYWLASLAAALYTTLVMLDSAALTTGAMQSAAAGRRGATVALHSLIGFGAAFVGPLVPGAILDAIGGGSSAFAWFLAFAAIGAGALLGPLALIWSGRGMADASPTGPSRGGAPDRRPA